MFSLYKNEYDTSEYGYKYTFTRNDYNWCCFAIMEAIFTYTTLYYTGVNIMKRENIHISMKWNECQLNSIIKQGHSWEKGCDKPLNQASASGPHNYSSRLQPLCFLAYYFPCISFHYPSLCLYLFPWKCLHVLVIKLEDHK